MNNRKPLSSIALGAWIGSVMVLSAILIAATGGIMRGGVGLIQYFIAIVLLAVFVNSYAKAHDGQRTFGELFSYGFKATTIITLLVVVYLSIYISLYPEVKVQLLQDTREQMADSGKKQEEIDAGIAMVDKYFLIGLVGTTMFFVVLCGAIGSLVGAAISRKNPRPPEKFTA